MFCVRTGRTERVKRTSGLSDVTMQSKPMYDAGSNSPAGEGSRQETQRPREREASWSAVTEMHGASLHRRHRFRGVKRSVCPQDSIQLAERQRFRVVQNALLLYVTLEPAKAASRRGLPHALQDAVALAWAPMLPARALFILTASLRLSVGRAQRRENALVVGRFGEGGRGALE
jgi:hypothetical protein